MAKILIIDDEDLVRKSVEKLLKREGHEVFAVSNGAAGIDVVRSSDIDIVVTDIRMPSLNGIETLEEIRKVRAQQGKSKIPEICITGYADEELNKKAEEMGVSDYMYKPFDLRDFLACIKKHVKG